MTLYGKRSNCNYYRQNVSKCMQPIALLTTSALMIMFVAIILVLQIKKSKLRLLIIMIISITLAKNSNCQKCKKRDNVSYRSSCKMSKSNKYFLLIVMKAKLQKTTKQTSAQHHNNWSSKCKALMLLFARSTHVWIAKKMLMLIILNAIIVVMY